MAGIYIHVPFCRKACHYCNFHFSTSLALTDSFVTSLLREIDLVAPFTNDTGKSYLGSQVIETIYLGGGTPSLLPAPVICTIIDKIKRHFHLEPGAEITLEANPDDISIEKLKEWKHAGINRLSIGVQSFFDEDLKWMNRAHAANQAVQSVRAAIGEGFNNITIDLIYGTPALTDEKWKYNVEQALLLGVPHLSCYALTVEPSTALDKMISSNRSPDVDPEKQANQFLLLAEWLETAGYEHYEISNFALPGMRSRHNSSYWQRKHYLGLGPSAHSFNGISRQWNISNNALYIKSLEHGMLPSETEMLTAEQRFNEYVMTSLRTIEGLDIKEVSSQFGEGKSFMLKEAIGKYVQKGHLEEHGNIYTLTREGMLFADGISSELFSD
jgi:oxygen-independent coproporphyrinogen-3 oxidase